MHVVMEEVHLQKQFKKKLSLFLATKIMRCNLMGATYQASVEQG